MVSKVGYEPVWTTLNIMKMRAMRRRDEQITKEKSSPTQKDSTWYQKWLCSAKKSYSEGRLGKSRSSQRDKVTHLLRGVECEGSNLLNAVHKRPFSANTFVQISHTREES